MIKKHRLVLFVPFLLAGGCSGEEAGTNPDASSKDHVFKDQVRAIDKAKKVEQVLQTKDDKRRQALEEQNR